MINTVTLMGRLTHDPELKFTPNGTEYLRFQIAHNERKGEKQQTSFFRCTAWKNTAEFISKYFEKGNLIGIEGSLKENKFTDNGGNERSQTEITVFKAHFCESKKNKQESFKSQGQADFTDDTDLPF